MKQESCKHHWVRDMKRRKSKIKSMANKNQSAIICTHCGKRSTIQALANEAKIRLDATYNIWDQVKFKDLILMEHVNYETEVVGEAYNEFMKQINENNDSLIKLSLPQWINELKGPVFCDDVPMIIEPSCKINGNYRDIAMYIWSNLIDRDSVYISMEPKIIRKDDLEYLQYCVSYRAISDKPTPPCRKVLYRVSDGMIFEENSKEFKELFAYTSDFSN